MAVTQYIGARYVPQFYTASDDSNNWEANVAYEALTIVTELNQSYTSKKPVPANIGAPSLNPEYWVLTGNFNAQLNYLSTQVPQMQSDIAQLQNLAGKSTFADVVFISDSYAEIFPTSSWIDRVVSHLGIPNYHKAYHGGTGFVGYQSTTFESLLTNLAASMTDSEKASVTAIVVGGGANDGEATELQLAGAINNFKIAAAAAFPNAVVYVCFLAWSRDYTQQVHIKAAYDAYTKLIPSTGMRLLADCGIPLHNLTFLDSGSPVHPTQDGEDALGIITANALQTGSFAWTDYTHANPTQAGYFTFNNAGLVGRLTGNVMEIELASVSFGNANSGGTEALNYGTDYTIGTYVVDGVLPLRSPWIPVEFTWSYQQTLGLAEVRLNNGNIEFKWRGQNLAAGQGGYLSRAKATFHYMSLYA